MSGGFYVVKLRVFAGRRIQGDASGELAFENRGATTEVSKLMAMMRANILSLKTGGMQVFPRVATMIPASPRGTIPTQTMEAGLFPDCAHRQNDLRC